MSFTCLHCLRCQPDDNICADCNALMDTGSLCRCGERIAARGDDFCLACIADAVRKDPLELDGIYGQLRDEVIAYMGNVDTATVPIIRMGVRQAS